MTTMKIALVETLPASPAANTIYITPDTENTEIAVIHVSGKDATVKRTLSVGDVDVPVVGLPSPARLYYMATA